MVNEAFFAALLDVNVRGVYFVMRHAIEIMPDGGSIILSPANADIARPRNEPGLVFRSS
jgi:hypothetical protein